ncbi:MAG TPA: dTDP-4-dehydrorhamnose reductase [Methylomirabilota bacterium]|nr:dTDP-4-dehydrorhamnose reductase [Methylomirabilota bacterium]
MKVLILGAKGSLGQTFVDLYKDHAVSAWDRDELDITDEDAVGEKIAKLKPELIINCAAYNAVDKAEEDRVTAEQINGYSVGVVAKAAAEVGAIMVHYSSGQIFDGLSAEGYNEDAQPNPVNAYGKSKLIGEMELQENIDNFYLIRTCWLYGKPALGAGGKKSFTDMMLELGSTDHTVKAINNEFGSPTYVVDLAQATRALIESNKPFGVYHLTNSGQASRYDWAKEVFAIRKIKTQLQPVESNFFPRKAKRPSYEILNNTKFIELRPWTEALNEYLS